MPLALFDIDETLIDGDAATLWNEWAVDEKLVQDPGFLKREAQMMELYTQGELDMVEYMNFTLQPFIGKSSSELDALAEKVVQSKIKHRFYEQGESLISELQDSGHRVVLISASADFLVNAIARHLNVKDTLGIQIGYDEQSLCTGKATGILSFREGKVTRLHKWLKENNESISGATFYSDSINDLALLELVDHPVATNPDVKLRRLAKINCWPVIDWSNVVKN